MSAMEILSVVTCLFLGYWVVSAVLERNRDQQANGAESSSTPDNDPLEEQPRTEQQGKRPDGR